MNYYKQIAEMLGVKLEEEFKLKPSSKLYWILNGDLVVHSDFEKLREDIEKDMRGE